MGKVQKYLTVHLRNGMTFDVEGETLKDFPKAIPDSFGEPWHNCKTPYGKGIKIARKDIAAISEHEYQIAPLPW